MSQVAFARHIEPPDAPQPPASRGRTVVVDRERLDLVLDGIGELVAGLAEELDAVVLGGVVRRRDDRARLRAEVGREEGHLRRGGHAEEHRHAYSV